MHTLAFLLLCEASARAQLPATYFVDPVSGNDGYNGRSPDSAWSSLPRINGVTFVAGDSILLQRGGTWRGQLAPGGSGSSSNPIVVGAYGTGPRPAIHAAGLFDAAIRLHNQQHWEFRDLELTNRHPTDSSSHRYAAYLTATDIGAVRGLALRNLVIHDVNGDRTVKTCGGIFFEVTGDGIPTWFDGLIVEDCEVYDVSPVGIANTSSWATRTRTTNTNWTPSTNLVLRNNVVRRTARNGIILRVSHRPLIEHNVLQECAWTESGNAVFVFNCDSAMIQYNEAFGTRFNAGDADAGGFDGDYRCKNTIIQYNYSHDNEYGGVVVVSDGNGATTFNDGCLVRYNVLRDNLHHILRTSGNVTNTSIFNNTIVSGTSLASVTAIWHKSWGGYSDSTAYRNNIFHLLTPSVSYNLGASTNNVFDYNLFYGTHPASEPSDPHKITADPRFAAPDSAGIGWATASGFRLQGSSPAVNTGAALPEHPATDYLGNLVPFGVGVDRGAFECQESAPIPASQGHLIPDGGFERQLPFASLAAITSLPTGGGVSSVIWTIGLTTNGTEAVTDDPGRARTGRRYATFGNVGGSSAKRFQSPTAADSAVRGNAPHVIQFYYRTSGTTAPTGLQGGVSPDGTSLSGINQYALVSPATGTMGGWQKTSCVVTSAASTNGPRYGLGHVRFSGNSILDIDVDDFAVYEGLAVDDTPPEAPLAAVTGAPTPSSLVVTWRPPAGGPDGGGYLVVRGRSDPVTMPRVNGVYAAGNAIAVDETVAYAGADTSFVDAGLVGATVYYYRVHSVDKAYNYSAGVPTNGSTLGATVMTARSGPWSADSTWLNAALPEPGDDVVILSGHTVTLDTSGLAVSTLTIEPGGQLWTSSSRTSPRYLRISGSTVTNHGMLGGSTDALSFECLNSVTFQGSGTDSICRIRPGAGISGICMTIDKDMTLVYTGHTEAGGAAVYLSHSANDNIAFSVTAGHTVTFVPLARLSVSPHLFETPTASYATNATFDIQGSVILSGASLGLETFTGKTTVVEIGGALTLHGGMVARTSLIPPGNVNLTVLPGGSFAIAGTSRSTVDLLACSTTVHGSLSIGGDAVAALGDAAVTGPGSFIVGEDTELILGSPEGISASGPTGNVQTAMRVFTSGAHYRYAGTTPQTTGTGLPALVRTLIIDNTAGAILTAGTTVTETLLVVRGNLDLNGRDIVLGPAARLVEIPGSRVAGNFGSIVTTRTLNAPQGDDIAGLGVSITSSVDLGMTTILRGHTVQRGGGHAGIRRYVDIQPAANAGLDATLAFRYDDAEMNGLIEHCLAMYRSTDGGTSWNPRGGSVDTTANRIVVSGIDAFSRWTAADSALPLHLYAASIRFDPGWTMVSNPVVTPADSVRSLYPTAATAYAFAFDPQGGYRPEYRMVGGTGYWLKFPEGGTQHIVGPQPFRDSLAVAAGWNLVGSFFDTVDTGAITSIPTGLRASDWFTYQGSYAHVMQLLPGKAYWVRAGATGFFTIAPPGVQGRPITSPRKGSERAFLRGVRSGLAQPESRVRP